MSARRQTAQLVRAHAAAAADFEQALLAAMSSGKAPLPPWSKETERLRRVLTDGVVKPGQLSRMLAASPQLVVKVMRAAHSPLFGKVSRSRVELKQAVDHLGSARMQCLVYISLLAQVRNAPRLQHIRPALQRLAEASTTVTAIGWLLAQQLPELAADEMLMAGLMHNIGKLCLLANLEPDSDIYRDRRLQLTLLARSHSRVAAAMLVQMGLPGWLRDAVACQELAPDAAAGSSLLGNALAASVMATRTVEAVAETAAHLAAFRKLGLDEQQWQKLLCEVPATANAVRDLFNE